MARSEPGKEKLEDVLDRIDAAVEEGDLDRARAHLSKGKELFPREAAFLEWEAVIAGEDLRYGEALQAIDEVLALEPANGWARRFRAGALLDLGRFEEALDGFERLRREGYGAEDPLEEASCHHERGLCLDRLGRLAEADAAFREAARLAPDEYREPLRLGRERFDALVAEALDSVPSEFDPYLRQVSVVVREYPAAGDPDPFLLGLYVGVPRTERSEELKDNLDRIFIFKRSHETLGLPEDELREEVRKTVIHEIAHHFGFGEEDMGEYA